MAQTTNKYQEPLVDMTAINRENDDRKGSDLRRKFRKIDNSWKNKLFCKEN